MHRQVLFIGSRIGHAGRLDCLKPGVAEVTMKQIVIRLFVALTMCGITSLVRLSVIAAPQISTRFVWIFRLILASVLSPILYGFVDKRTTNWTIQARRQGRSEESIQRNQLSSQAH